MEFWWRSWLVLVASMLFAAACCAASILRLWADIGAVGASLLLTED